MASKARYPKGTKVRVANGVSTAVTATITAITQAKNPVITATAHGLKDTDCIVALSNITGMTALNDNEYPFKVVDDDTIQLYGVDTTEMDAFGGAGTMAPMEWVQGCEFTGYSGLDGNTDEIDITTICSEAKEYELGLTDYGNFTLEGHYVFDDPFRDIMDELEESKEARWFSVYTPIDDRAKKDAGGRIMFKAAVTGLPINWSVGSVASGTMNLRITGAKYKIKNAA